MPLKLTLGQHERVIIGNALVQNGGSKCELLVENRVPVLRGKHVMTEAAATTPCREIYFAIQVLYLENAPNLELQNQTLRLARKVGDAAPSTIPLLSKICDCLAAEDIYAALLLAQQLIQCEERILECGADPNKSAGAVRPPPG